MLILMTNTGAKLVGAEARAVSVVADVLSYDDETVGRRAGFGAGTLNSRKSFLRQPELIFEAGFVPLVRLALSEAGFPVTLQDRRDALDARGPAIDLAAATGVEAYDDGSTAPVYAGYLDGIALRDYQAQAIETFVLEKRGIIQAATGGGKTEIGAGIIKRVARPTLWLTHKLDLVGQTRRRIKTRLGRHTGVISEGEWLPAEVTVATVQTIMAHMTRVWDVGLRVKIVDRTHTGKGVRYVQGADGHPLTELVAVSVRGLSELEARKAALKRDHAHAVHSAVMVEDRVEKVLAFLRGIELLIVDEAHRASGNGFFTVISNCVNAYFRASLTATPLMKAKREDDLRLIATSGNVICRITNAELIRRGILAEPHFTFTEVPGFGFDERRVRREAKAKAKQKGKETYGAGVVYQAAYDEGVVNNAVRNALVVNDVRELVAKGRKTVVLFARQDHGKLLLDLIRAAGIPARLVYGEDEVKVRDDALRALREGEIAALVASTILDEGLDEPAISGIVLAGGGKSKISLFQRVGRAARKKHGAELASLGNTSEIRDYIDTGSRHLMVHAATRFKAVRAEEGWVLDALRRWPDGLSAAA